MGTRDQPVDLAQALAQLRPLLVSWGCDVQLLGVRKSFAVVRLVGAESVGLRPWLLRYLERELASHHTGVRGVIVS